MTWCDYGDLPVGQCAHCRGILEPDATGLDLTAPPVMVSRARYAASLAPTLATDRLTQLLRTTPAVYAELGEALHGTRVGMDGERVTGGGGDDRPLPLQVGVVEHRHQLVHDLRFWVAQVGRQTRNQAAGHSVPRMCAVLIHAVPNLEADDKEALTDLLADWQGGTRAMSDLPKMRGSVPLPMGTCPAGEAGWSCGGALRIMLPADKARTPWVQCGGECGARYGVTELPAAANVLLPLSAVSELTGTPVRTLQYRVQHGLLEAPGGMARLGDVLRTEVPAHA